MAKKIKFPLEMKNGIKVRTIEELKENFDVERVMENLLDGKLQIWLSDRYYIQEAEEISKLDTNDSDIMSKLYKIIGIENQQEDDEMDIDTIRKRKEKLLKLKEITDDETIWDNVDIVAFNQEELADLLDEEYKVIYLYGEKFQVPYSVGNISYIGINEPEVYINAVEEIDLEERKITFKGVKILNKNIDNGEKLYQLGLSYLWERNGKEYDKEKATEYFMQASQRGHADAMAHFADYLIDNGCYEKYNKTLDEVKELIENSISKGSSYGLLVKGKYWEYIYNGNKNEAIEIIKNAINKGEPAAFEEYYYYVSKSQELKSILEKGIELKSAFAANYLGQDFYSNDKEKAHKYYELSVEFEENGYPGDGYGYYNCGVDLINGYGVEQSKKKGIACLKKACSAKYSNGGPTGISAYELSKLYWYDEYLSWDDPSILEEGSVTLALKYAYLGANYGSEGAKKMCDIIRAAEVKLD